MSQTQKIGTNTYLKVWRKVYSWLHRSLNLSFAENIVFLKFNTQEQNDLWTLQSQTNPTRFQKNIYGYINLWDSLKIFGLAGRRILNSTGQFSKVSDGRLMWNTMRRMTFPGGFSQLLNFKTKSKKSSKRSKVFHFFKKNNLNPVLV